MFIGYLNYYETGCGIKIIFRTGKTENEIKKNIDDYYLIGYEILKQEDVLKYIENLNNKEHKEDLNIKDFLINLEYHCPLAYKHLMEYKLLNINYDYSINLS